MVQTVKKNKDILRTNNLFHIKNYKSNVADLRKSMQIPDPPQMLANTKYKESVALNLKNTGLH